MREMHWQRLLLWLVAFPFVFLPVAAWLSGVGHGSFAALCIFASWGYLGTFALRSVPLTDAVAWVAIAIWLLVLEPLYFLGLAWVSTTLAKKKGLSFYFIAPLVHMAGGTLAASLAGSGHLVTERNIRFNYLISIPLLVVFFGLDWLLLQRDVEAQASSARAERGAGRG